jgi:hypothetical protein
MQRRIVAIAMSRDSSIPHHQHPIRPHGQRQIVQRGDDSVGVGEAAEQANECDLMWWVEVGGGLVRGTLLTR